LPHEKIYTKLHCLLAVKALKYRGYLSEKARNWLEVKAKRAILREATSRYKSAWQKSNEKLINELVVITSLIAVTLIDTAHSHTFSIIKSLKTLLQKALLILNMEFEQVIHAKEKASLA